MEPINEQINEQTNEVINTKRKYVRKEGVKCGRPKKYNTIEDAKYKAREQRSAFKKKQYVISKQFRQTITELQRTAIRQIQKVKLDETDTITIINILDKYKQSQLKEITENNDEDETIIEDSKLKEYIDESQLIKMAYVSNASKKTLQDIADKIGKQSMQQNRLDDKIDKQSSEQQHKQLDAITMRSIAYDLMYDQLQVQQYEKNMSNNAVGIGDSSLVAITNVNAQIASAQSSQDIGIRVEPMNQKMTRQITLEQGRQKSKEQVYQQDKEQMTIDQQQELGDDVLLGIQPAPPIIAPQPTQQLQQQPSLVQEDAQQQQIENLQAQQMTDMIRAMNYKLGSMDQGLNPINAAQFHQMDITEKINQAKIKKNFISEQQMNEQIEIQKEHKKKYGKKLKKNKTKST
ncbi:MAG: hypothetical protein EZS28_024507 [Streblomastix strix]|uniref:Uncharacterized protein n=1 Tax=Streblomastix strix TaxID=222440 RepID=A0A5J4VBL3_9EUKA|nr:MAG: hypothetical protein EZS28_024507 [Streblomastix strix]